MRYPLADCFSARRHRFDSSLAEHRRLVRCRWTAGSLIVLVVIAVIWIAFVVRRRTQQPILTLVAAGAVYTVLAILLAAVVLIFFPEASGEAPVSLSLLLTAGFASALILNVTWGAFLGLTSQFIIRETNPRRS